ncbi:kinase-like domain-containing protein [Phaeosphaeria sp. MPI-PUGE-AT-0046c]|nr:kinase-like domain-containing protein [Phaeosphaeria sp. MPI-PUGE-AT-0046c]
MSPVGENDLYAFFQICSEDGWNSEGKPEWHKWIQNWFVCLPSALAYIHSKGIRHQDIKPSNIVHKGEKIYFTDFGSSSRFIVGHTTSTVSFSGYTPMYAAPEINDRGCGTDDVGRHGRSADIFALGCVFCDLLSVWQGQSLSDYHGYLSGARGTSYGLFRYSEKIDMLGPIFGSFGSSTLFPQCIQPMLWTDRALRPTAAETATKILSLHYWWGFECECTSSRL